jgi:hypothetical protein
MSCCRKYESLIMLRIAMKVLSAIDIAIIT